MSQYRNRDVKQLVDESKKSSDVITLEATVVTGFEGAAMDECREKCRPLIICRAQGRIFFNIASTDFDKVLHLRSVDNLFLLNDALGSIELSNNKEKDLEYIKSLVHKVSWDRTLTSWAKLVNFGGILFPTHSNSANVESINENIHKETNGNINEDSDFPEKKIIQIDKCDNVVDKVSEEISKLHLSSEEELSKNDNSNGSRLSKEKRIRTASESSDDMYFSAEEECSIPMSEIVQENAKQKKPLPESNILKFRATCNRVGKHSFSSMEAAACFGGELNDKFKWAVDLTNFDLNVILNINKDVAYVSSAITDKSMHRRNITHFGYVTLRSTVCYNLVRLAEPTKGEVVLDPLCGGGSIPIEGSLGFPYTYHVCGDNDDKAMKRTLANVNHLRTSENNLMVDPVKWTAKSLPLRDNSIDICVTDLPFGKRSGRKSDNLPLYTNVLTEMARVSRCATARAVLLTHDKKAFTKALSGSNGTFWRQIRAVTVNQGGLFSTAFLLLRTAKPFMV